VRLEKLRPRHPSARERAARRGAPGTLRDWVAREIRQAIVEGRLQLGEALSELKLAEALGVSRTPVREALDGLQRQGLIEIRPQSGSFVFFPSDENVGELAEFRRILEVSAIRFCFARRRDESRRAMQAACDAMDDAIRSSDRLAIAAADVAFHEAIVAHSANELLIGAYALISGRIGALLNYNAGREAVSKRSNGEHRAVVAAFAKGDVEGACAVLDEHVSRMRPVFQAARRVSVAAAD
jgi:DNA-binding GntR family transcriptional regulator